jgi:hypothetical protein
MRRIERLGARRLEEKERELFVFEDRSAGVENE